MPKIELIMPRMGESIMEATILNWMKQVGDNVSADETILEIATDKVDSEIPSPVDGRIIELLFQENDVVEVGKAIAIIETDQAVASLPPAKSNEQSSPASEVKVAVREEVPPAVNPANIPHVPFPASATQSESSVSSTGERFYSPLVRNIAKQNGINQAQLDALHGTGVNGRVTKKDILSYITSGQSVSHNIISTAPVAAPVSPSVDTRTTIASFSGDDEIIQMDRMRQLIANHMVRSKQTSPHVTSFIEVDVTPIVKWRTKIKDSFADKYGQKITYTPIIIEAVIKAIHDFPMVNISVDGTNIIKKKHINIGMATAMNSGNLIVPVIKDADRQSLLGLTQQVNDLANRARNNKLKPEEIQDGTFTITNVGTFGNVMGTPIINQPQVAIMAIGAIRKKPAVIETPDGDFIGIRHMMFLSLSYDHRVVDGFLGGSFLKRTADYLETFDESRSL